METGKKGKNVATEFINKKMGHSMLENGTTMKDMVMVVFISKMEMFTLVNGTEENSMEKV